MGATRTPPLQPVLEVAMTPPPLPPTNRTARPVGGRRPALAHHPSDDTGTENCYPPPTLNAASAWLLP